jgi:hypothetical protein
MIATRRPEMLSAPFSQVRELLPQYPARPAFDLLGDKTQGVLGRVLEENVDMVRVDRNVNYLDAHLRACAPDDRLSNKTNLSSQDLPAIFWGYHQMIGQQRHRMPIVKELFHSFKKVYSDFKANSHFDLFRSETLLDEDILHPALMVSLKLDNIIFNSSTACEF